MKKDETYNNGQIISQMDGDTLTHYFKDGKIRAKGKYINDCMEGEWVFYRGTGQLWQIGNFKSNEKHGKWIRYNRDGAIEYNETFDNGKLVKMKK